ncbi:hypothetical protein [Streptomyces malaysiensis]|nr:hypothetical protein [Streptomyces malaysiensis]
MSFSDGVAAVARTDGGGRHGGNHRDTGPGEGVSDTEGVDRSLDDQL